MIGNEPLHLSGSPETRGRQQAALVPESVAAVRAAVQNRLVRSKDLLGRSDIQEYLRKQWAFLGENAPAHAAETGGVAAGYGMSADELSAYLHLGILDCGPSPEDGCSTLAATHSEFGPFVAKNRDYGGDHRELQRVFIQSDPERTSRQCLFVGSLGSPGAFSSGMNSAGLALADTRVDWPAPGAGWLRYHLMTEILWRAETVEEAVDFISSVPHAGGGSLALADASGAIASVEFGHPGAATQSCRHGTFAHTNHYFFDPAWAASGRDRQSHDERNSHARLQVLRRASAGHTSRTKMQDVIDLFSSHENGEGSLCRHGGDGEQGTISTAIFCCETREVHFFDGNPCMCAARRIALRA